MIKMNWTCKRCGCETEDSTICNCCGYDSTAMEWFNLFEKLLNDDNNTESLESPIECTKNGYNFDTCVPAPYVGI